MLQFKLIEDDREVKVVINEQDRTWEEVVEDIVTFLHACSYVFVKEDVVNKANEFKDEIQQAERDDGEPF